MSADHISMVVIDSVGINMGQIVNCNSQLKHLLGYDKASIITKNVTKLMPSFYAQLHNSFVLNFIEGARPHLHLVNHKEENSKPAFLAHRVVPALTSDSLLLEIGLHLQILLSSEGSLLVAGFL